MSYKIIKKLPSFDKMVKNIPLSDSGYKSIKSHRKEIESILSGLDNRLIVIVGPCSAWPYDAVLKYAEKLTELSNKVSHKLKIVMRVYIQKPRTVKGWTGPINQPNPLEPPDIENGIKYARKLMINVIEMGMAIADEALFTHSTRRFLELLSWVAIGARSSEDQEHRIFASSLDFPVGIKNPTHGSLKVASNSVTAAQHKHVAIFDDHVIETDGNPYAHMVLRGGNGMANYETIFIKEALQHLTLAKVHNPAIIIDVSHDNCIINGKKDFSAQSQVILNIIQNLEKCKELKRIVKGFMLESFLKSGNQNIETAEHIDLNGLSITDPCLGWEETEKILLNLASKV